MESRSDHSTGRSKVKTGCRTCKIRKVKCDEGRPACHRCISTGRVCDGYGIWGGGGNTFGSRQWLTRSKASRVIPQVASSAVVLASGTETERFEWFTCQTASKLPGSFVSGFWNTLLLQASLNEPAVSHAVLALSSFHKGRNISASCQRITDDVPDDLEKFTLQHYVKAISHLKPHFSNNDRTSLRVASITCVVFVSLELLRGHFETAQTHLHNGLKILREMQVLSHGEDGIQYLKPCRESTDEWILEAFVRFHLQVELFKHVYHHPCQVLQPSGPDSSPLLFHSTNEAWQEIGRLLNKIFHLTYQGRQQALSESGNIQSSHPLFGRQQRIRARLAQWFDAYKAFKTFQRGRLSAEEERYCQLLRAYHTLADIMMETCVHSGDESIFDNYTDQFISLITQLADLWSISPLTLPFQTLPGHQMDMSLSVVDMGWIAPLYFAAIKCRTHRIRLEAIRLLESSSHREGIWDSKTAACVARKVMELEERDSFKDVDTADHLPLSSSLCPQDLLLPKLPESHRIREVEMVLSGSPMDKIMLFCRRAIDNMDCRVLISEYSVHLQRWRDENVTKEVRY